VLLVNLGTPDSPRPPDVRRYLREFLSDPRVVDLPAPLRWGLVHLVVLPFRPRRTAAAYRAIWGEAGSPLLVHSRALERALAAELGAGFAVALGMRYGRPSIDEALARLEAAGAGRLLVLPLFPHYASSSTGSALERVHRELAGRVHVPPVTTLPPFFDDPGFVAAAAAAAREALAAFAPDHLLLSFHGLPERQLRRADPTGAHCLARAECCAAPPGPVRSACYRAQCFASARSLAAELGLPAGRTSVAFQSRLGRGPWIRPYTDERLAELARSGVQRLAVLCPSFVADCLETLEEIGLRGRARWRALGGEELRLLPCPNAHPTFVAWAADRLRRAAA
jgi:ferrochelatase